MQKHFTKFFFTAAKMLFLLLFSSMVIAQPAKPAEPAKTATIEFKNEKWTGDLDGMVKRRIIRVLVAYNKTNYFLDQDTQRGIAYDAMKTFETDLNKKLKLGKLGIHVFFIPANRDEFLTGLVEGRGDIAIANLTITPDRLKTVDFTTPTLTNGSEIVVTGPGAPAVASLDDLAGQQVYIRRSSSFFQSIADLNARFKKEGKKEVVVKEAPENLETEDILEMTNAGLVKITISDKHTADFWKQIFTAIKLHPDVAVRTGTEYGWAIRKNSPQLKAELDAFVNTHKAGTTFGNITLQKYLKSIKYVKSATSEAERKKLQQLIALFRKYGDQYGVDWLLMAAQGYQESRLDQNAKSHVGAIGVMQIMPATGKDMNVGDIAILEPNVHAGIKYMRFMMDQYYKDEPMDQLNKMLITFASYNCGPGRMRTLRKLTAERGLNPNVWFGNVERITAEKVGQETVTYVSNIFKYYIAYKLSVEEIEKDKKLKEATKVGS